MDLESLKLIEGNNFYVRHILVTTPHESHVQGLKTTLKIYEAEIYAGVAMIEDFPCIQVHDGEQHKLAGFDVSVLNVSGHSKDSMVYRVEDVLFTGDALGAGRLGDSPNAYARAILKSTILEKFSGLDDHLLVFPGHGPPSTLAAEKMFNPAFIENTQS